MSATPETVSVPRAWLEAELASALRAAQVAHDSLEGLHPNSNDFRHGMRDWAMAEARALTLATVLGGGPAVDTPTLDALLADLPSMRLRQR